MATPYGSNPSLSPFSSPTSVPPPAIAVSFAAGSSSSSSATSLSPAKDATAAQSPPSTVLLCRRGQETVQEIVGKTAEIFQFLRTVQLPSGAGDTVQKFQDRRNKFEDQIRQLELLFRKLRGIYDHINDTTANLDAPPVEELLPYVDEHGADQDDIIPETKQMSDEERELIEERRPLFKKDLVIVDMYETLVNQTVFYCSQIKMKNGQLKDIIDLLRTLVWEINSMMAMRRTGAQ